MHINDFDYHLPEELIAQYPSMKRDESRLLVVHRKNGSIEHKKFYDIIDYLKPGDCLVMNDSRVIPARLFGEKADTGAQAEILLIRRLPLNEDQENAENKTVPDGTVENLDSLKSGEYWEAMVRPGRRLKPGASVVFSDKPGRRLTADILEYGEGGIRKIRFRYDGSFHDRLEECGHIPLPPYIDRPDEALDRQMYQTVYSRAEGSVAAPTAGLHFTEELLDRIRAKGVKTAQVTLHVGIGTFRPVKCEQIEEHHMHFEEYEITQENADIINETKAAGGRVISVGTTSTRTMESAADEYGRLAAGRGSTDIFIYPGYRFRIVDSLITNFHLPKSTLLMLISALYDREKILEIYKEAVENRYAFFSYGDAMFLE